LGDLPKGKWRALTEQEIELLAAHEIESLAGARRIRRYP
jgi:hypothetical protein